MNCVNALTGAKIRPVYTVQLSASEIPLEKLTPILSPEQEAAKRRELEQRLYEVFRKYVHHRQTEGPAS